MSIDWGLVLVAVITAIPVAYGIYRLDRRSKMESASAEKMGVSTEEREGAKELRTEWKDLMTNYRDDIQAFRQEAQYQDGRITTLEQDRDECRLELARLRRKFGENGPVVK